MAVGKCRVAGGFMVKGDPDRGAVRFALQFEVPVGNAPSLFQRRFSGVGGFPQEQKTVRLFNLVENVVGEQAGVVPGIPAFQQFRDALKMME